MKNYFTLFLVLIAFGSSVFGQDCSELFISEYVEGSGNNKGIEVYNPTNETIDLKYYLVARYSNGGYDYYSGGITRLKGTIAPGETHVLVNGQTESTSTSPAPDAALQALADQLDGAYPSPTYMNGNDAIVLFKDATGSSSDQSDYQPVDLFGIIAGGVQSSDEGWTDFTDAYAVKNVYDDNGNITSKDSVYITNYIVPDGYYWLSWTSNHTLVRKADVLGGVPITEIATMTQFVVTEEWDTLPGGTDIWTNLGTHNCNCHPASVSKTKVDEDVKIYPQPAQQFVTIESQSAINELRVINSVGALVLKVDLNSDFAYTVNTESYSKGVYLLQLNTTTGIQTRKFILQ